MQSKQSQFFRRKSLPLILVAQQKVGFLKNVVSFFDQKSEKEDPFNFFVKSFNTYRNIEAQKEQQIQQVQELQQDEGSKKSIFSKIKKLGNTYRKIKSSITFVKTAMQFGRNVKNASGKLKHVNIENDYQKQSLYGQILDQVYNTQELVVSSFQKAIIPPMQMLNQMVGDQATKINDTLSSVGFWAKLIGGFFWWLIKTIFIPQDALDAVIMGVSLVAGAFSMGAGFLAGTVVRVGGTLRKIIMAFKAIHRIAKPLTSPIVKGVSKYKGVWNAGSKSMSAIKGSAWLSRRAANTKLVMGLTNVAKGMYIGFDIYDTDQEDVKMFYEEYGKKSQKWKEKTYKTLQKKVFKPLQDGLEEVQFVSMLLGEVNNDMRNTLAKAVNNDSGILGNYGRAYNTKFIINQDIQNSDEVVGKIKTKDGIQQITKKDTSLKLIDRVSTVFVSAFQKLQNDFVNCVNNQNVKSYKDKKTEISDGYYSTESKIGAAKYMTKNAKLFKEYIIIYYSPQSIEDRKKQVIEDKKKKYISKRKSIVKKRAGENIERLKKFKEKIYNKGLYKYKTPDFLWNWKYNGKRSIKTFGVDDFDAKNKKTAVKPIFYLSDQNFIYYNDGYSLKFSFRIKLDDYFRKTYLKQKSIKLKEFFDKSAYYRDMSRQRDQGINEMPIILEGNVKSGSGQIIFDKLPSFHGKVKEEEIRKLMDCTKQHLNQEKKFKKQLDNLLEKLENKFKNK